LFGALILAKPVIRLISNTLGTPAIKDNSGNSGGNTTITPAASSGTKSPEYFKAEQERYQRELDDAVKTAGADTEAAEKARKEFAEKQAALQELQGKK
jgi:hypothetical protein